MSPEALQQIRDLLQEKAARSPAQQKIGSHLLYAAKLSRGESIASGIPTMPLRVHPDGAGRALVDIAASVNSTVLTAIAGGGGEVVTSFPQYQTIRARMPLSGMEDLAALPDVTAIHPAAESMHRKLTTSEGDVAHRANLARSVFGIDGGRRQDWRAVRQCRQLGDRTGDGRRGPGHRIARSERNARHR